jgi:succinate dehydrogenase/fumarate reductase flavoprotein subunit
MTGKKFRGWAPLSLFLTAALAAACASGSASLAGGTGSGDFLSPGFWDAEYDVVVIGFGGAGATAAITAADAGARVLLLEKAPKGEEGGNTRYSGQLVLSAKDREKAITYYKAMRGNYNNQSDEVIEFIVDGSIENRSWLINDLGVEESRLVYLDYIEYPDLPGSDGISTLVIDGEISTAKLWNLLVKKVTEHSKIDVWYSSPAVQLVQDKNTKIVHGVKVENGGKLYNVRAVNGVVMAMGGFENSDEMLENYAQLADAHSKGARYNTGDGIKMAIDVGADLWHMSALSGPDINFVNPETGIVCGYLFTNARPTHYSTGFVAHNVIIVGNDGTRFMNETIEPKHGHIKTGGTYFSLLIPQNSWCVFDETARNTTPAYLSWSQGMVEEIAKGWVIKANTLQELAVKMDINPANLAKTISDYNRYCAQGNDPDFHVDSQYLKPIATGPFYGIPLKATLTNTQGGARRNIECEVLDPWGKPIPHLYSAGEFGSFFADIYNGGGNVGECAFTGRKAGANAAAPKRDAAASVMGNRTPVDLRLKGEAAVSTGPGEYLGTAFGIGGELIVKVKMDNRRIVSVELVRHNETPGVADLALKNVPQAIVTKQSTQVDTITGATTTSNAIITAVNDALSKAK